MRIYFVFLRSHGIPTYSFSVDVKVVSWVFHFFRHLTISDSYKVAIF
jgi:hypothetical protein